MDKSWKSKDRKKPYNRSTMKYQDSMMVEEMINNPDNVTNNFEDVPLPSKGRPYSVSIAVPASILEDTCLKGDLRTYLVGQLARSAVIFGVDEIIVFDDHCWKTSNNKPDQQKHYVGEYFFNLFTY